MCSKFYIVLIVLLVILSAFKEDDEQNEKVIFDSIKMDRNNQDPTFSDFIGAWRVDIVQSDDIVIPTYFVLRQDGDKLDGTVSIKSTNDLQIRNPHWEGNELVFGTDWNISYRLRSDNDKLYATIDYGNGKETGCAIRVTEAETRAPQFISLPELRDVPSNGLAQTPPMGWNSWNHFGNRVDDAIVRAAADALVRSGLAAAGYVYINIDDCWEGNRDEAGNIVSNKKFPDMKALADYVHSRGLKLGIYSSPGPRTCGGYEGSYGHEEQDAKTYASWGIDYLKYDWCSASRIYSESDLQAAYQKMGLALVKTGRPIVYALCEYGMGNVGQWGQRVGGNLWRTGYDINDSWKRMVEIGFNQDGFAPFAGPGHWNDPDMLEVGNGGMTNTEYRTHFSLWCLLAAPLLAGNDLNAMSAETLEILGNKEVIAIDQDLMGKQGVTVAKNGDIQILVRVLQDGSKAVGIFNLGDATQNGTLNLSDISVYGKQKIRDLWLHKNLGVFNSKLNYEVPSHGVVLLKIVSVK